MILTVFTVLSKVAGETLAGILGKGIASASMGQFLALSIVVAGIWLTRAFLGYVAVCTSKAIGADAERLFTCTDKTGSSIQTYVCFTELTSRLEKSPESE